MASKLSDVVAALKSTLETSATGTIYEPDAVKPVLFWPSPEDVPDGIDTFYLLALGERTGVNLESCHVTDRVEIIVLAATRSTSTSDNPWRESPSRMAVAQDLEADVLYKLRQDEKLGGEVLDVFDIPPVTDFERFDPAWVLIEIRLGIKYRFERSAR